MHSRSKENPWGLRPLNLWRFAHGPDPQHRVPNLAVAEYAYDKLGRVTSVSTFTGADATASVTSYAYDANGRVTSIDYPGAIATEEFGYDSVGNLLYAKGGPESTYYTAKLDSLDRVTDVYLTGSGTLPNPLPSGTGDIRVAYEGATDLVTDVWRGDKHVTYSYDAMGRLKTYRPTSGPISGVNLWYDYNALGQKKEVKILDGSAATVHDTTYDYYPNGWLKSINYDGSKVAEYSHNTLGLVSRIDFYSGGSATGAYDVYDYDANDPRDLLKTITMHYKDANGQPTTSVTDYTDGNGHPNVDKAGNQLTMDNLAGHWEYTYDHGGRVSSIVPPTPVPEQGVGGTYGYNWLGQVVNPPAEPNHLVYNDAGLPTLWPGMYSYTHKANGLPSEVKDPSGTATIASCSYDSAGSPSGFSGGGVTTVCSWDADGAYLGYADTAGGTETQSALTDPATSVPCALVEDATGNMIYYVCDPQGYTIASVSSAGQTDYHSDAAGQLQMSTKSNGEVGSTYVYGPSGRIVSTTDPSGGRVLSSMAGMRAGASGHGGTPATNGYRSGPAEGAGVLSAIWRWFPKAGGAIGQADANLGGGVLDFGAGASAQIGIFTNGVGGAAGGYAHANNCWCEGYSAPGMKGRPNTGVGVFGGLGYGPWFSNARYPSDLDKMDQTFLLQGGWFADASLAISWGSGIYQVSGTTGLGWGGYAGLTSVAGRSTTIFAWKSLLKFLRGGYIGSGNTGYMAAD